MSEINLVITLFVLCLLGVGGSIGSFINVVVYRLPLRKSLVHPGSQCPSCEHAIRFYDNIPVFSWFILRGRCRDCGAKFSFRYPAVEIVGVLIAAASLLCYVYWYGGFESALDLFSERIVRAFLTNKQFGTFLFLLREVGRVFLVSLPLYLVLTAGLIAYDRNRKKKELP